MALPALLLMGVAAGTCFTCSSCSLDINKDEVGRGSAAAAIVVVPKSPQVEITSPQRATFHSVGPVQIEGFVAAVNSGTPVTDVAIDGQVIPINPDGTWQATVDLDRGLNILSATVTDVRGGINTTQIGLLAGEWAPTSQPVQDALAMRLNDPALDAIGSVIEPIAQTIDLAALTQDPIYDGALLGGVFSAVVNLENPSLQVGRATIDGDVDGLHVNIDVTQPYTEIKVEARAIATLPTERATVNADSANLRARIELTRDPSDKLRINIHDVKADFQNFRVTWNTGTVMPYILPLLRGLIEDQVEKLLVKEITKLQSELHLVMDEYLNPTVPTQIMGKDFLWDVRVEQLAHDADGMGVVFNFDAPPQTLTPRGSAAPGSFHTPAISAVSATTTKGLGVSINDDLINRALHAAWASGLLEMDLSSLSLGSSTGATTPPTGTGTTAPASTAAPSGSGAGLGALGGPLTVGTLATFIPELLGAADANDPLTAKISVGLPPILEVTGAPDLMTLSAGEVYLELLVDRGFGPELLLKVALHLRAGVTVAYEPGKGLRLSSNRNADVGLDVMDQPLVRVDERKLQIVLATALTPVIPRLVNQVGLVPMPTQISHLSVFDLTATADGAAGEHLKIELDMVR